MKHWIGLGLMLWGGAGMVNQFFMIQALQSGNAPTAALNSFDPATVLSIGNPSGAGYTSPGMLTDAGIVAAGETLAHPINTLGTIGGGWFSDLFGSKDKTLPSELSSVGYVKVGASGQHWSCTGPQGADNDTCVPVSVDASGNMTATGPQIKASTAN